MVIIDVNELDCYVENFVMIKWGRRFLKLLLILLLLLQLPYMVKFLFPTFWGKLEGTFEKDLTAFSFVIGKGSGECRIKNSKIAFTNHGAKIYLGHLSWSSNQSDNIKE